MSIKSINNKIKYRYHRNLQLVELLCLFLEGTYSENKFGHSLILKKYSVQVVLQNFKDISRKKKIKHRFQFLSFSYFTVQFIVDIPEIQKKKKKKG